MKDESNITIRVSGDWLRRLDEWRLAQEFPVTRAAAIRVAVDRLLQEAKKTARRDQ